MVLMESICNLIKGGKMKKFYFIVGLILMLCSYCLPTPARPGEEIDSVLKRFELQGQKPVIQDDYISYKLNSTKFVSPTTLFLKVQSGVVLEEDFIFNKNSVHEKDVYRSKSDINPTVHIPHHSYLVGDFSQIPREKHTVKSTIIGTLYAPLGAVVGTVLGTGYGIIKGSILGAQASTAANQALGGDLSGAVGVVSAFSPATASSAITGVIAGLPGGLIEGTLRGSRIVLEKGIDGADRNITGNTPADSQCVVVGGRIGKKLALDEQVTLLDKLCKFEQNRLSDSDLNKDIAILKEENKNIPPFDSGKSKEAFENNPDYNSEDNTKEGEDKDVSGMW